MTSIDFVTHTSKEEAAQKIASGQVGVFPVDTVYGIVASANRPESVSRFYKLKQRTDKPGTLIAGNVDQLIDLGIGRESIEQASIYWPNPTSVVLPVPGVLNYLSLGKSTLAVRIPADETLLKILLTTGPIITSSANRPGEPTVTQINQAVEIFGSQVDFYVDGGDYSGRQPSTVVVLDSDGVNVLREGAKPNSDAAA